MNKIILILIIALSACAVAEDTQICFTTSALNVNSSSLWDKTDIIMCWDDHAMLPEYDQQRYLVRAIIDTTWNTELSPGEVPEEEWVQFVGWNQCVAGDDRDVKITIASGSDRVDNLGTYATYVNLNYLKPDRPVWDIERAAIHEFGHLLGLAHEHNRRDTDGQCSYKPQGGDGDTYYGEWDHDSVMNYCNSKYGDSVLSESDAYWIKRVYYPHYYDFKCQSYSNLDGTE